jgi:hypothetical protein
MDSITRTDLLSLINSKLQPRVSLFLPTHRGGSEQDVILWRRLLDQAQGRLAEEGLRDSEAREILRPARALQEEPAFWKEQSDGLAAFLAPQMMQTYRQAMSFRPLVMVGRSFHVRPLLPLLAENGRFYILALSRNAVRLLEATRETVSAVPLRDMPENLEEALRSHDVDEPLSYHTRHPGDGSSVAVYHGQGVGIDDRKTDLMNYFHQIDHGLHRILAGQEAPMVLAGVEYLLPIYREASHYPHLLPESLTGSPDRLSDSELHTRALPLVLPHFEEPRQKALALYRELAGTGLTSADLAVIVAAAHEGKVETLFAYPGPPLWGHCDPATGRVDMCLGAKKEAEDLVNLAAIDTLRHGQTVFGLEPGMMPEARPMAAIFCLPLHKRGKRP